MWAVDSHHNLTDCFGQVLARGVGQHGEIQADRGAWQREGLGGRLAVGYPICHTPESITARLHKCHCLSNNKKRLFFKPFVNTTNCIKKHHNLSIPYSHSRPFYVAYISKPTNRD